MSDVFREVDEEVRKDRALTLWNRYGRFLIGGVVGVVAATAAWQGWTQASKGTLIAYATAPGDVAADGSGDNSHDIR